MSKLKSVITVEEYDDLSVAIQDFYSETTADGKKAYVLQVDGVQTHPDVKNLQTALNRQKEENRDLKERLRTERAKTEGLPDGFSVDEYNRLREEAEDKGDKDDKDNKGDKDNRVIARLQRENSELKASLERVKAEAKQRIIDIRRSSAEKDTSASVTELLSKAGVRKELLGGARALILAKAKIDADENGEDVRAYVSSEGGELDVPEYVTAWLATEEGKAFVTPANGGGAPGGNAGSPAGVNPFAAGSWNKTAQSAVKKESAVKAERFAKAAGFASLDAAMAASKPLATK